MVLFFFLFFTSNFPKIHMTEDRLFKLFINFPCLLNLLPYFHSFDDVRRKEERWRGAEKSIKQDRGGTVRTRTSLFIPRSMREHYL